MTYPRGKKKYRQNNPNSHQCIRYTRGMLLLNEPETMVSNKDEMQQAVTTTQEGDGHRHERDENFLV